MGSYLKFSELYKKRIDLSAINNIQIITFGDRKTWLIPPLCIDSTNNFGTVLST